MTYQVWQQTDRNTLKIEVADNDDFLEELCNKLQNLKHHAFYSKQQALFLKHLKISSKEGKFLILLDFAENDAFVIENAAQSFHWNNNQATIFTVVIYYKERNELRHVSMAIISDCLSHDTAAVYL